MTGKWVVDCAHSRSQAHVLFRSVSIQQDLGLEITDAQIIQMEAQWNNIDFDAAAAEERKTRHDVMAHGTLI